MMTTSILVEIHLISSSGDYDLENSLPVLLLFVVLFSCVFPVTLMLYYIVSVDDSQAYLGLTNDAIL